MKKKIFALTFFAFTWLAGHTASAQSSEMQKFCQEKISETVINFTSSYGKLKYDTTKNSRFLKQEHTRIHGSSIGKITGLATQNAAFEINVGMSTYYLGDEACIVPSRVDIFFGYQEPTVYIAKEILHNKCQYQTVLRHEQTHQQINILALEYFLPQMKRLITEYIKNMKPITIEDENDMQEKGNIIIEGISARMNDLIEQFQAFLEAEQRKLDNNKNYTFESEICN